MPKSSKRQPVAKKKALVEKGRLSFRERIKGSLTRRPHRTLRLTRRRDYLRPIKLPGYVAFTHSVNKKLWQYRKTFLLLGVVYAVLFAVLVGVGSQDIYQSFTQEIKAAGEEVLDGDFNALGQAGLLFVSIATVGINDQMGESQQIFTIILGLMVWLATVWLLRNLLAGHKVRLRDGLYSAGAPFFATVLIAALIAIQLLPIAIAMIGYAAANASGLLAGGVEAMLFWLAAGALGLLSLYWVTSSLVAMIIITLPGMYPMKAIRIAGDMMLGRRVKVLLRWLWMLLAVALSWAVVLFPVILLDLGLKSLWPAVSWLPILPVVILLLSTFTIIWCAAYVYLFYREVVDNDEQ